MKSKSLAVEQNDLTYKKKSLSFVLKKHWRIYLLLVIPTIYLIIFNYIPMAGITLAFKDFNLKDGIWGSPWAGFKHFELFFSSPDFSKLIINTIVISFYTLIVNKIFAVGLALAFTYCRRLKLRKSVQMLSYIPHFFSTVIMVGILDMMLANTGIINSVLELVGIGSVDFLTDPGMFRHVYVYSGVWQNAGYQSIMFVAAFASVSVEPHEAARMDGASIWKRIWHIDLPGIAPTLIIMLIMNVSRMLNVGFEKAYMLQNPFNLATSEILDTYVYKIGLGNMSYEFATAVGLFKSVVSLILIITVNKISAKVSETSLW